MRPPINAEVAVRAQRIVLVLICAALFCSASGSHWLGLQTVAWANMLISNCRTAPLAEAVAKTFNGRNPCDLCTAIQKADKTGKMPAATAAMINSFEAVLAASLSLGLPRSSAAHFFAFSLETPETVVSPLTPPPRLA